MNRQLVTKQRHGSSKYIRQEGKVAVRFLWKFSIIASIILSVLGTIILNLIF